MDRIKKEDRIKTYQKYDNAYQNVSKNLKKRIKTYQNVSKRIYSYLKPRFVSKMSVSIIKVTV